MMAYGGAKPGDRTMIDALEPALAALAAGKSLGDAAKAARAGADVVLLERYNHLGGLSTGGHVIWIDRMTDFLETKTVWHPIGV